jgi:hypothetical protein
MGAIATTRTPAGWGSDDLSTFLELAHHNTLASFANLPTVYQKLRAIDEAWAKLLGGLDNLREPKEFVALPLAYRAHASFRASARLSLAGQVYESVVVDRSCLESALYGLYVAKTEGAAEVWLHRNDSDGDLGKMKETFQIGTMKAFLTTVAPKLGAATNTIYQSFIEFGGHPNPLGVLGSAEWADIEGGKKLSTTYLFGDSVQLHFGLKGTAQAGFGALAVSCLTFETRAELLGVSAILPKLAKGL